MTKSLPARSEIALEFDQALARFVPQIEAELRRLMTPAEGETDAFYGMMHYHLGWLDESLRPIKVAQGKLLRPVFTLLCCQTAGGDPEKALPAAAAVELIHNFSLIHDDIEDQSHFRRGRPTVWTIWGQAQAINTGDALFVLARNALLKLGQREVASATILEAVDRLDQTCLRLCRGQFLDMKFEKSMSVTQEAYLEMIEGKTAALLACAGYLGSLVATGDQAKAQRFWELGLALGLAFQIQDDWLGIWGDEALTGKPTADDLRRRKKSLPVVFALNHADPRGARLRRLYRKPTLSEADITEAITLLEQLGAKTYTESMARRYIDRAEGALEAVETAGNHKRALQEMARFLIERVY